MSSEGILTYSNKVEVLKNYPMPKNTNEVKIFVAFANYYQKYVSNFSKIALPPKKL